MRTQMWLRFICAVALVLFYRIGMAASIIVDTTIDDIAVNGNCTLREAIIAANSDTNVDGCVRQGAGPDDNILLSAGTYTLTLAGRDEDASATGDLDVTGNLLLAGFGAGVTNIDGGAIDRVIHVVSPAATVVIAGVTIRNGDPGDAPGGGILNLGELSFAGSIEFNTAAVGGGIYNQGTLRLLSATVESNTTADLGTVAPRGAGLFNASVATATLRSTTINANSTPNSGLSDGGGIFNAGTLQAANATLSGNQTLNGMGGGLANEGGNANLNNITVTNNSATSPGGGLARMGASGTITLANTIVAANPGDNCSGLIVSSGYNLDSATSCGLLGTGDLAGTDPLLASLADNSGATETHALISGSPAVNAGNPSGCVDSNGVDLSTDQRGLARPGAPGTRCDIGAYEVQTSSAGSSSGGGGGALDILLGLVLVPLLIRRLVTP